MVNMRSEMCYHDAGMNPLDVFPPFFFYPVLFSPLPLQCVPIISIHHMKGGVLGSNIRLSQCTCCIMVVPPDMKTGMSIMT